MGRKHRQIVLYLLIVLLTACQPREEHNQSENLATTKTTALSKYPGIDIESIFIKDDNYQYSVHIPKLSSQRWNQEIEGWIEEAVDEFVNEAKTNRHRDSKKNVENELYIDFEIYKVSEQFISVKFKQMIFLEGRKSKELFSSYNFDRKNDEFLRLSDLFRDNSNYLKKLSQLSYQKLIANKKIKKQTTKGWIKKGLQPKPANFKYFFIRDDKLILLFEPEQLGPSSIGALEQDLSKNELKDILKEGSIIGRAEDVDEKPKDRKQHVPNKDTVVLDPGKKHVALTFDDGPHKEVTPKVLDILNKYEARATFFVLGNRAEFYPEILRRAVSEGHEIGNHSWSHPHLTKLSQSDIKNQLSKTFGQIAKTTGAKAELIRPPFGEVNDVIESSVNGPIINWSVDTRDWDSRNPNAILSEVQSQVEDGSIILMHDIYPSTAESLAMVLDWLQKEGYQIVTVSDLLRFSTEPESPEAGKVYFQEKQQ